MSRDTKVAKFEALTREVRRLFHRLKAVADQIHGSTDVSASHRAILESLFRSGPQSVPAMARARPVSRQHIQKLVNVLLKLDLVELAPNPVHKSSPLVKLTSKGTSFFERLALREKKLIEEMNLPIDKNKISQAAETITLLSDYFESSEWLLFLKKNSDK
jgi:DNA-binding MarR family transcriptional regulator